MSWSDNPTSLFRWIRRELASSLEMRPKVGRFVEGMVLSLVVLLGNGAHADDSVPASEPIRAITLPIPQDYVSLAGGEGGTQAFVSERLDAVNIWAMGVYYWPALLAGVGVLGTLVGLGVIRQRTRHAQIAGYRYCRECGYCLEGFPSSPCPECGNSEPLVRSVVGRSRWRRARFTLLVIAAYWCGFLTMHAVRVPRVVDIARTDWAWSPALAAWAQRHGYTAFKNFTTHVGRINVIDIRSGRVINRMLTRPARYSFSNDSLAPDDRTLLVNDGINNELLVIQPGANRVLDRQNYPVPPSVNGRPPNTLHRLGGFSADGRIAYYAWTDHEAGRTHLMAWNLDSHTTFSLFQLECVRSPDPPGWFKARDIQRLPSSDSLVLATSGGWSLGIFPIHIGLYEITRPKEPIRQWDNAVFLDRPIVDAKEESMYLLQLIAPPSGCRPAPGTVTKWSLATGAQVFAFPTLAEVPWDKPVACEYDGRQDRIYVVTNGASPVIHVGDCLCGEWVHELRCPPQSVIRRISLMPQARLLFAQVDLISATLVGNVRSERSLGSQILAFDLRSLSK